MCNDSDQPAPELKVPCHGLQHRGDAGLWRLLYSSLPVVLRLADWAPVPRSSFLGWGTIIHCVTRVLKMTVTCLLWHSSYHTVIIRIYLCLPNQTLPTATEPHTLGTPLGYVLWMNVCPATWIISIGYNLAPYIYFSFSLTLCISSWFKPLLCLQTLRDSLNMF